MNTAVDLGVFNFLIFLFGAVTGVFFILFKMAAFLAAVLNSYIMNKSFVFGVKEYSVNKGEFSRFILVSFLGMMINTIVAFLVYTLVYAYGDVLPYYIAANAGAISGSVAVFFWNFFGYKFFVFKDKDGK